MANVILATRTVARIDEMVKADQGSAFRGWLGKVIGHIGDAYRTGTEGHRSHMGASLIGSECARAIWYNFRWATKSNFDGRLLRLFNRGHLEEARFIAMLLMIGCDIYQQDENGNQFRISHAEGHFGGSGDGVAVGIPDRAPGTAALTEFKTHNDKSFSELKAKGVRDAKFEHYVQMNVYMRKMGIAVALYLAVNKNNDELYGEIIPLDSAVADQFLDRGEKIVWMTEPPNKINESPGFFKCRWCDHRPVCHLSAAPDTNCRTCRFADPAPGGVWQCSNDVCPGPIDKVTQLKGCSHYERSRVI
jgi:hypothetical protein